MTKKFNVALSLLLILSMQWLSAEETTLEISKDRSAVIRVTESNPPDPDVSGSIKGSSDLKAGKSAMIGDLLLKKAAELKDSKAGLYLQMTGKSIEAIGFVDAKFPPDPQAPKVLDIKAETVTEGDQSAANFKLNLVAPTKGEQVPSGSGDLKLDGDFKALQSSGKFAMSSPEIKAEEIPFESLSMEIVEVENKTTISFEIKVAKTSELAAQLDQIPVMAPMVEQQLKQANIKYEGLDFPAPTEEGEKKIGKAKLTLIDVRGTIRPFLGFASGQLQSEMGPDVDVQAAFENMLEVKLDKFAFSLNAQAPSLDGTFEVNLSSLDKFYEGYLVLLPAIQKQSNQELAREAGELGPLIAAFMELNSEQAAAAIRAAVQSNMKLSGNLEFKLEPKEQDMSLSASGNLLTSNYKEYVAKAKELGLPVAEKAVGNLDLELRDSANLVGDMYLYTDGDLVKYYKGMLGKAASSSEAPKEVVDAINALQLNQVAMKVSLEGNKMSILGMSDTSDLTAVSKLILSKGLPQLTADLLGVTFELQMPETEQGTLDVKAFFANYMPDKNEAQIKEALGLPAKVKITMDAPSENTKLVAVEAPEIAIDGKLAEVQSDGQKLLASSPSDLGGVAGAGGGGNKWGLIALGALILVGVGGFLMSGKKS